MVIFSLPGAVQFCPIFSSRFFLFLSYYTSGCFFLSIFKGFYFIKFDTVVQELHNINPVKRDEESVNNTLGFGKTTILFY